MGLQQEQKSSSCFLYCSLGVFSEEVQEEDQSNDKWDLKSDADKYEPPGDLLGHKHHEGFREDNDGEEHGQKSD